jgi:hypothetical protein
MFGKIEVKLKLESVVTAGKSHSYGLSWQNLIEEIKVYF